ncbi:nucleotide-diphospho-sugar transferase [Dactylonectria macrodidyma]|uniref:Nucleotide-diphospho-sugar transferase n=1 Tax=Dactylonectria macrodidyma TaxID=307937 RepID=A0A9P9EAT6_9HYPO|nr:nucleotide-diphospho-sugar transferase [Dactylonectria macrodidyma]
MATMRNYIRRLATRLAHYQKLDDEEHQLPERESGYLGQRPKKYPRFTRPGRTTVCLFLADLVLFGLVLVFLSPLLSLLRHNKAMFGAHFTVTRDDQSETVSLVNQIPRIFHQTCKNETVPKIWAESQQSCLKTYSDFEYKLWTDERARDFLSSEYPWFLDTWDNYPFPIQRADAIRYFVLYHYGGIYLDMDTICHKAFPINQIETTLSHNSLFEATLPTGITNDIMISSARHPAFASAISRLPTFHRLTRFWARVQPYAAIMISTGPLFITLATAEYLYGEPSLPSPTVQVINSTDLRPYITDLQTATWHGQDARVLKWLADKPLVWFMLGTITVVCGVYILNKALLVIYRILYWIVNSASCWFLKVVKLSVGEWVKA